MRRLAGVLGLLTVCLVVDWAPHTPPYPVHVAAGQISVPGVAVGTGLSTTITSVVTTIATATGGSTTFCPDVSDAAAIYVATNGLYFTLSTQTPSSTTGAAPAGTWLVSNPWGRVKMVRQSTDAAIWVQCFQ